MSDSGPRPHVLDMEGETVANHVYRSAAWTGAHLQLTLMSIPPGGEVGLEVHEHTDQFLRVEAGSARVQMGPTADDLPFDREVGADWAVLVPAGVWHNLTNTGESDLKLYSIYAPPHHPHGTVHPTKADAETT